MLPPVPLFDPQRHGVGVYWTPANQVSPARVAQRPDSESPLPQEILVVAAELLKAGAGPAGEPQFHPPGCT